VEFDITIWGQSTVSLITSLMLADKGIEHNFIIKNKIESFSRGRSLSNPIINRTTRNEEEKYLPKYIINQVPRLINYESISFNENFEVYRTTKGNYPFEVYSIDNRLRLDFFVNEVKNRTAINLLNVGDLEIQSTNSKVNIIGGGQSLSYLFNNLNELVTINFKKERIVFCLNLKIDLESYSKLEKKVTIYYLFDSLEILVYPFLHISEANTINITINIIKGGIWDQFSSELSSEQALQLLKELLPKSMDSFLSVIKNGECVDLDFTLLNSKSYYKNPAYFTGNMLYLGVGETITKSDPIIGQGYNSGLLMVKSLVDKISLCDTDLNNLASTYENVCLKTMNELYEINAMMTQGSRNKYLNEVFDLAAQSKPLCDFLLSTFEDTSLYFPWLTDESETVKLISRFK